MPQDILSLVMVAVNAELDSLNGGLTESEREQIATNLKYLAEELMVLGLTDDDAKREYHHGNIAHYLTKLKSLGPAVRVHSYRATIDILARVLANFSNATGSPLI